MKVTEANVRHLIDNYMVELAMDNDLKYGDFTPRQSTELDLACAEISELINQWYRQNK